MIEINKGQSAILFQQHCEIVGRVLQKHLSCVQCHRKYKKQKSCYTYMIIYTHILSELLIERLVENEEEEDS